MATLSLAIGPCSGSLAQPRSNGVSSSLLLPPDSFRTRGGDPHPLLHVAPTSNKLHLRSSPYIPRAVTVESNQAGLQQPNDMGKPTTYHFVVANARFMLDEEEHFREQLFERKRLFEERNREQDFWLVVEPKFLDNFPNLAKRLKRPACALVSTDGTWMRFMKLRLDRVLMENFEANSLEEALECNPVDLSFEKPSTWTAPYPKYESGWWETFLPPKA